MGWASGSQIAEDVWDTVRKHIPVKNRKRIAREIVSIFEDADCDTLEECDQLMEDAELVLEDEESE